MHVHLTVVVNEAQFAEPIHEETDAGTRRPDHLGERFLTDLRDHWLGLIFFAEVGQQQQHSREPFLAGVKEMIHQILFDTNRVRQQIGHKQLGKLGLVMQHLHHGIFVDAQETGVFHGGRGRRANRVSGEAGLGLARKCAPNDPT